MGIPKTFVSLEENPDVDDPFRNRHNDIEGHTIENGSDGNNLFDFLGVQFLAGFHEPVPGDDEAPLSTLSLFVRSTGFISFGGYDGYFTSSRSSHDTRLRDCLYFAGGGLIPYRPASLLSRPRRTLFSVMHEVVFGLDEGNEHDDDAKRRFLNLLKGFLQAENVRAQKTESVKELRSSWDRKDFEFLVFKHQLPLLLQNESHSGSKKLSRYHPSHFWQVLE